MDQGKEGPSVQSPIPLTHSEFMVPVKNPDKDLPFADPGQIPIHPSVWKSKFAYSEQFVNEVIKGMSQSMKNDLEEARKISGKDYGLEVLDWGQEGWVVQDKSARKGLSRGITASDLKGFRLLILPKRSYLRVRSSTHPEIILDSTGEYASFIRKADPLRLWEEELGGYNCGSEKEPKMLTWWTNNMHDAAKEDFLVLRNFAIVFNNLGLEWAAQGKK